MNKEELIQVYEDTKARCSEFDIPLSEKKYHTTYDLSAKEKRAGEIIVEPLDTVSAISKYVSEGKTAVLNMASNKRPGGGVKKGAMAQEECLFRCSNLFTIPEIFYPLGPDEFIYTHQATFIKSVDYAIIYPMDVDVITIAALNMNKENKYYDKEEEWDKYTEIMSSKINNLLDVAASNDCVNIILGAWGCGVFKNDPTVVATLFKKILETKKYFFDRVIFAVINDQNSVANNYMIFSEVLANGISS